MHFSLPKMCTLVLAKNFALFLAKFAPQFLPSWMVALSSHFPLPNTLHFYYYRKRGSASYIVREILSVREREREIQTERERDGSDVPIVALKLAMNLHFPLRKIRTLGDELTLSLAKNSHFSFLPSRRCHHCDAEIRNEFTLSIAKKNFALFVPPLSKGTSRATSDRKPMQMIKSCPVLFCSSHRKTESN